MTRFPLKNTFLLLTTVLVSASPSSVHFAQARDPRDTSSTQTVSQANKASLLEQESLVSHVESGKYSQVRMKPEVKVASHDFFTRYANDFALSKDDAFKQVLSRANPLSRAKSKNVIRYQQRYKNLPVIGTGYVLQTDAANHVLAASGKIISGLNVETKPSVSESHALESAKHAVPAEIYSWEKDKTKFPKGTLAISFKDFKISPKNARLVYRFTISSEKPSQSYIVEVDAHTGEVLNKINNRFSDVVDWNQNIKGCQFVGDGTDRAIFPLCDKGIDGQYRLMCQPDYQSGDCAARLKMIDARRPNPQAHNGGDPDQDYVFADEHQQTPPVFAEVEDRVGGYLYLAMLFALKSYYLNFGWAGYDGSGQIPILNYVQTIDEAGTAAFYDPDSVSICFDPAEPIEHDSNNNVNILYATLIAGHEFTHGVLRQMIPGFVHEGESASLDESFGDIFGILAGYYGACYPAQDLKDCLKKLNHPGVMQDPRSKGQPTTYKGFYYSGSEGCSGSDTCYHTPEKTVACDDSNYQCDPDHRNGRVQDYMFYLLASGGAGINDPPLNHPYNVESIGPSEAGRIAFQTMLARLSPTSTYPEARDAWIAAAEDLYGENSKEARAVTLAWYAVGIGDIADLWHSPADGDKNVAPWPAALEWEDQADEVEWQVQASTSPNFDRDLLTKQTSVGTRPPNGSFFSTVNVNLKPNTNYYWRVRAKRNPSSSGNNGSSKIIAQPAQGGSPTLQTGWGDWSLLRYFETDKRASTLKSPVETGTKIYPWGGDEFKWTGVEGGKEYWLQTSENKDLGIASNVGPGHVTQGSSIQNVQPNNPLQSISLDGVFVDPNDPDHTEGSNRIKDVLPFALKVNHTYYWGVIPYGPENIQGNWSNHQQGQIFQTSTPGTKLTLPANAAKVSPWGIKLQWEATPGAVGYILKVSKHLDFSDSVYTGPDPTGTSQVIDLPLDKEGEAGASQNSQVGVTGGPVGPAMRRDYYWSVTPKGPPPYNEKGQASQVWGFDIDREAAKPVLISPPNGGHVPYKQPSLKFTWKPVDHAVEYVFTLYNRNADGGRGAALDSKSIPASQEYNGQAYIDLNNEGVTDQAGYCWQVQAIGPENLQGPSSDTFCYVLAPDKPIITSPLNGASGVEYHPTTFTWNSEWAPGGYMISVTVPGSSSPWVNVSGKSYTVDLKAGTTYSWTVDAKGLNGELTNSELAHFSTKAAPCNAPGTPQNLDPPGNAGAQVIPNGYQYRWSSVPDAVQYEFTVYWHPDPDDWTNQVVVYHNYYTGTVSDPITLNIQSLYVWTVRAKSSCGLWSQFNQSSYIATLGY